jgi:hypothetical protein
VNVTAFPNDGLELNECICRRLCGLLFLSELVMH